MSARCPTPGDLAEYRGAELGHRVLNQLLTCDNQADRCGFLRDALQEIHSEETHSERLIGSFVGQIVNVLEKGLGLDT
jgi:hypothetical protein